MTIRNTGCASLRWLRCFGCLDVSIRAGVVSSAARNAIREHARIEEKSRKNAGEIVKLAYEAREVRCEERHRRQLKKTAGARAVAVAVSEVGECRSSRAKSGHSSFSARRDFAGTKSDQRRE